MARLIKRFLPTPRVVMAATSTSTPTAPAEERDRHGFRGVPPPATFSLDDLSDDALLTEGEVASYLRVSKSTVAGWRCQEDHPIEWAVLPGGFVRVRVGSLRAYMARGVRRRRTDLTDTGE